MVWLVKPTSEILETARARLAYGWCSESLARDAHGRTCAPSSPNARAWCMFGALIAAGMPVVLGDEHAAETYIRAQIGHEDIETVNDRTGSEPRLRWSQAQALEVFDRAIELARENGE